MNAPKIKPSNWHFPPDFLAMLGTLFGALFFATFSGLVLPPLFRARKGDTTVLWVALALAAIGIVLLFIARLPLYRQRRFFTFGPGALDKRHRRIYLGAYCFIVTSAALLLAICGILR